MQARFVDDAGRSVALPARVGRVMAAGAPAEVMLYTLVPDFLVGRNRVPGDDALEFFPPAYRTPTLIRQLPEVDNPAADAELVALKPDVYIDYGTVQEDYIASVEAVQRRTRVPGIILNGAVARIPEMYRRLGAALGVKDRGDRLGGTRRSSAGEVSRRCSRRHRARARLPRLLKRRLPAVPRGRQRRGAAAVAGRRQCGGHAGHGAAPAADD